MLPTLPIDTLMLLLPVFYLQLPLQVGFKCVTDSPYTLMLLLPVFYLQCDMSSHAKGAFGDYDQSDSSHPYTYSTKTDSELSHYSLHDGPGGSGGGRNIPKRLPRRRLLSSEEFSDMLEDDDDADVDDETVPARKTEKPQREGAGMQ